MALRNKFSVNNISCIEKNYMHFLHARFLEPHFFKFGECFPICYSLCYFLPGLYSKHRELSPVIIFLNFNFLSWKEGTDIIHSCFGSNMNAGGTNLVHIFLCPKFCSTVMWTLYLPMFKNSAVIQRKLWQSSKSRSWTASVCSSGVPVEWQPLVALSFISFLLSWKGAYHW